MAHTRVHAQARSTSRLLWALWLLIAAAAIGAVAFTIERMATRHLEAEARRVSLAWVSHMSRSVHDLERLFAGEMPSAQARDQLATLRGTVNLHRFRLYDSAGRLLLRSESLDLPVAQEGQRPHAAAAEAAALAVMGPHGAPQTPGGTLPVHLQRTSADAGPVAIISEAHVAVRQHSRLLGVVGIELDLSDEQALTAASFRQAAIVAAAAMSLLLAAGALLHRQRMRAQQQVEERARFLARHDLLTGVLNRESFRAALAAACHAAGAARTAGSAGSADSDSAESAAGSAPARRVAVLAVDLRRFHEVTESHGVAVGDHLLREVATQLRGLVRRSDLLARLSGDQFVLLLHGIDAHAALAAQAERILAAIAEPRTLPQGGQVQLSACVGAALLGVDGHTPEALLRSAELALTRAKSHGGSRWSSYDAALDHALQERRELAQELRAALATDQLRLHFQPIYDGNGALVGYEALARWPHAQRGYVPPAMFIGIAEEAGLIDELGRWVLRTACREAASWPPPLHLAVNLSPAQVREGPELLRVVRDALAAAGLPGRRLEVEITESLLMGHDDQVLATLHGLVDMGVRIAMDDFGTGFSSLAYLWRYPFGKVKIDRAFTQRLGHEAKVDLIVRSIVRLAHALGMRVNAEGVETEQQRAALVGHGCDELQGYLLGRPQPAETLPHRVPYTVPVVPVIPVVQAVPGESGTSGATATAAATGAAGAPASQTADALTPACS